jgi:hypothetical protein
MFGKGNVRVKRSGKGYNLNGNGNGKGNVRHDGKGKGAGKGRRTLVVGDSTVERVEWLQAKVAKLKNHQWDASQFLYELVGDGGSAYQSCFADIGDDPRGFRILETMVPALALRDVQQALEASQANLAFLPLLGAATSRAWDRVANNAASAAPFDQRGKMLNTLRVLFHLLGLDPLKFWVLQPACTSLLAGAVCEEFENDLEIQDLASSVVVRLDAAVRRERAADEAAAADEDAAAAAAEQSRQGRRYGTAGASSDAQLEDLATKWRGVPPYPTAQDFPFVDDDDNSAINGRGAPQQARNNGAAAAAAEAAEDGGGGGGDGDGGGGALTLVQQRPVTPHNRARGGFPSMGAYLGTHFTLLREDCLAALRPALKGLLLRDAGGGGGATPQEVSLPPIAVLF